jgi:hypothetical protein
VDVVEGIVSQGRVVEVYDMKREKRKQNRKVYMLSLYTFNKSFRSLPTTHPTFPMHSL